MSHHSKHHFITQYISLRGTALNEFLSNDTNGSSRSCQAMFTLYRIVKRSVAESVPDRASVHTRTATFEAVSAPEQYCSAPLLKVERSVWDRFLRRSESSLNTFIGAEIATEPRFGTLSFQVKR